MCNFGRNGLENPKNGMCPKCFAQSRSAVELSKDVVLALITRIDACSEFVLAAAKALETNPDNPADIIATTADLMTELAVVDQTVWDLLEYIDEVEGCCGKASYCDGCPYTEDCDGVDCFFEDPDFFAPKSGAEVTE